MLIGSLLRFSSNKDDVQDSDSESSDDLMPKSLPEKVTSLTGHDEDQAVSYSDYKHLSLDDLSEISRSMLMDKNLEVSKVRPFFWNMVETYVDRFQVFPFDATKALFSYLELHEYPEDQLRDLVKKLEKQYKKQHGSSMRESKKLPARDETCEQMLDDEISELRETLKYAAIVGERLDGEK